MQKTKVVRNGFSSDALLWKLVARESSIAF